MRRGGKGVRRGAHLSVREIQQFSAQMLQRAIFSVPLVDRDVLQFSLSTPTKRRSVEELGQTDEGEGRRGRTWTSSRFSIVVASWKETSSFSLFSALYEVNIDSTCTLKWASCSCCVVHSVSFSASSWTSRSITSLSPLGSEVSR